MTTNRTNPDAITVVNIFEIEPENLDALLTVWRERAQLLRGQPGFRSLRLFRALSAGARFQMVSVQEWDDINALHAATCQQSFREGARRAVEDLGVIAHPGVYAVTLNVEAS